MKFKSLHWQNYGSYYGEHEINLFNLGLLLVLGQNHDEPRANSNGSGKSTPWEALDWCLWGTIPKGDHVDSVINAEAGKDCSVTVWFEDDAGRQVIVERFRKVKGRRDGKESGLVLQIDGVDQSCLDVAETQARLEAILGLDRDVFHAAVMFSQNDAWRFADGTDAERIEILTRVLQLGEIDEWLTRAKKLADATRMDRLTCEGALTGYKATLSSLQSVDFAKQIEDWEQARRTHLMQIDTKILEVQAQAREIRSRAADETGTMNRLRELEANAPREPQAPNWQAELDAEANIKGQMLALERRSAEIRTRVARLRDSWTGTCAECGQVVSKDHIDRECDRLSLELIPLANQVRQYSNELAAVLNRRHLLSREHDSQMDVYRGLVTRHANEKAGLQKVLWQAQELRKQAAEADAYATQQAQQRQQVVAQQNPWIAKQLEIAKQMEAVRIDLATCEGRLNGLTERLQILDFWVEACGPKGLKSYILDTRLQEMTDAANQWVKLLTGGTFWVRFETQTLGRSGKLANKINIRVFQYQRNGQIVERNYKSWSGGQKARVSMGVDFGLSRLVAARARGRYDLLILDEVFKHLDRAGREAVVEMLHALRSEKSSVIVIDHDAEFGASFENVLWVDYRDGRSTMRGGIRGGTNAEKSAGAIQHGGASAGTHLSAGSGKNANV